ncbi:hypothetical protein RRG08_030928 [Elysia crispata]|uniref:Uncharacterized protein n=1 Tax=Elysia crispata TaxID=231223 RepID=A0AAE1ACH1_9GAST|nr:hypothetical protein RRG08_030928 [Elysia crispata]
MQRERSDSPLVLLASPDPIEDNRMLYNAYTPTPTAMVSRSWTGAHSVHSRWTQMTAHFEASRREISRRVAISFRYLPHAQSEHWPPPVAVWVYNMQAQRGQQWMSVSLYLKKLTSSLQFGSNPDLHKFDSTLYLQTETPGVSPKDNVLAL